MLAADAGLLTGLAGIIAAAAGLVGAVSGLVVALRKKETHHAEPDHEEIGNRMWFELLGQLDALNEERIQWSKERADLLEERADLLHKLEKCQEARLRERDARS